MTNRLLEDFAEIASDWFWEMDEDLRFSYFSGRFGAITGLNPARLIGKRRDELETVRNDPAYWESHLEDLRANRPFRDFTYRFVRDDGSEMWVRTSGQPITDANGRFAGYRGVGKDETSSYESAVRLEQQNRELSVKEATLEQVQRMASIGAWNVDLGTSELHWSEEIFKIFELSPDTKPTLELARKSFPEKALGKMRSQVQHILKHGGRTDETLPFVTATGENKWVRWIAEVEKEYGPANRVFGTFQDVTEERERSAVMKRLAHTDTLTGLANRTVFQNTLKSLYDVKQGKVSPFTLFLIDIDHFKHVNDFYGHDAGDMVLRFAGRQLTSIFGEKALIARLGGDELAVVNPVKGASEGPLFWANKIRDAFLAPLLFHGNSIELTVSIGIAIAPAHGSELHDIMRAADLALYRSKRLGRDRATVYDFSLTIEPNERSQMLAEFRSSAKENRMMPYYQPIVDLATGRHFGFEALMRWDHPSRGILAPGAFACVFEDSRSAQIVTKTMVMAIAEHLSMWTENQLTVGKISLNLTGADLRNDWFTDTFLSVLEQYSLEPDQFIVEITGDAIVGNREQAVVDHINGLSQAGVEIALDDFGTGFASLTHLQILPVDIVKIDKSFVLKPDLSSQDLAILKAIIDLGNALGFSTIASGIEEDHHCRLLRLMGCDRGQGFLFSRPMPVDSVPGYLLKNFVAPWIRDQKSEKSPDEILAKQM